MHFSSISSSPIITVPSFLEMLMQLQNAGPLQTICFLGAKSCEERRITQ